MQQLAELLAPERVACQIDMSSKKRTLEYVSNLLSFSNPELRQHQIFNCLISREKLGSTALGNGVAIPHGRLENDSQPIGAFIQLTEPVDFNAVDARPVDLVFALLVSEACNDEHLKILAQLAEMFSNQTLCEELRQCTSNTQLYNLLSNWESSMV